MKLYLLIGVLLLGCQETTEICSPIIETPKEIHVVHAEIGWHGGLPPSWRLERIITGGDLLPEKTVLAAKWKEDPSVVCSSGSLLSSGSCYATGNLLITKALVCRTHKVYRKAP